MTDAREDGEAGRNDPSADPLTGPLPGSGGAQQPPRRAPMQPRPMEPSPMQPRPMEPSPMEPRPVAETAQIPRNTDEGAYADAAEPVVSVRPGPTVLEADSWGAEPWDNEVGGVPAPVYEGRRRAEVPPVRLWIAVGLVLIGLAGAVALPMVFGAGPQTPVAAPLTSSAPDAASPLATVTGEAMSVNSTPPPTPTPSATRPTTTSRAATPTRPTRPPFSTLTLEAESADLSGSAESASYANASGGRIARRIGDWGPGADGTVTFRNISIPSTGTYTITIHFVQDDQTRQASISITGLATRSESFSGGDNCCTTKVLTVSLTAGTKTISITHGTQRAPSIDRIVIRRS